MYDTIETISELEHLINVKNDRANHLSRQITDIRSRYKNMTTSQLEEAIRDVRGMQKEVEETIRWCDKAQKRIAKFFAPAMAV